MFRGCCRCTVPGMPAACGRANSPVFPREGVKGAFCMHLLTWVRLLKQHGDVTAPTL